MSDEQSPGTTAGSICVFDQVSYAVLRRELLECSLSQNPKVISHQNLQDNEGSQALPVLRLLCPGLYRTSGVWENRAAHASQEGGARSTRPTIQVLDGHERRSDSPLMLRRNSTTSMRGPMSSAAPADFDGTRKPTPHRQATCRGSVKMELDVELGPGVPPTQLSNSHLMADMLSPPPPEVSDSRDLDPEVGFDRESLSTVRSIGERSMSSASPLMSRSSSAGTRMVASLTTALTKGDWCHERRSDSPLMLRRKSTTLVTGQISSVAFDGICKLTPRRQAKSEGNVKIEINAQLNFRVSCGGSM